MPSNNWIDNFTSTGNLPTQDTSVSGGDRMSLNRQIDAPSNAKPDSNFFDRARNTAGNAYRNYISNDFDSFGRKIQPDFITKDGKIQSTANKIFNDKTDGELQELLANATGEDGDRHLYQIRNTKTGDVKLGTAKNSVAERYKDDPSFKDNWEVLSDRPVSNAEELENLFHGNTSNMNNQTAGIGSGISQLESGNTEIYNSDSTSTAILKTAYNNVDKSNLSQGEKTVGNIITGNTNLNETVRGISEKALTEDKSFQDRSYEYLKSTGQRVQGKTNRELAQMMIDTIAYNNNNTMGMTSQLLENDQQTDEQKNLYANLMLDYDATPTDMKQFLRGTIDTILDPTTAIGLGTFGAGTVAVQAGKQAGKETIKQGLKRTGIESVKANTKIGAIEGGFYGGAFDAGSQKLASGSKDTDWDKSRLAMSSVLGASIGGALAGTISHITNNLTKSSRITDYMNSITDDDFKKANFTKSVAEDVKTIKEERANTEVGTPEHTQATKDLKEAVKVYRWAKAEPEAKLKEEMTAVAEPLTNFRVKEGQSTTVKPTESTAQKTNQGIEVSSQTLDNAREVTGNMPRKVVDAETTPRQVLSGQQDIQNPKTDSFVADNQPDYRIRSYNKETPYVTELGTESQKAGVSMENARSITDVNAEVKERLKYYDEDSVLRNQLGTTQKYTGGKNLTDAQVQANRVQFEINQYKRIADNTNNTKAIREQAKKLYRQNKHRTVKAVQPTKATEAKIDSQIYKETVERIKRPKNDMYEQSYSNSSKESYKMFQKSRPNIKQNKSTNSIVENIKSKQALEINNLSSIIDDLEIRIKRTGKDFDVANITNDQRKRYRAEITKIEDAQNRAFDLKEFENGNIDIGELRYREMQRVEHQISDESAKTFKTEGNKSKDLMQQTRNEKKLFDDIGYNIKDAKFEKAKESSGKVEDPKRKAYREEKELDKAEQDLDRETKRIERDRQLDTNPLQKKSNQLSQTGQKKYNDRQWEQMKETNLSSREIALESHPQVIKAEKTDAIKTNKEANNKTVNDAGRKATGTDEVLKTDRKVTFKDTLLDASNSVTQIMSVLLKSFNIGKLTKMTGESVDIRNIIGDGMSNNMFGKKIDLSTVSKKDLGDKGYLKVEKPDGSFKTWKDLIKPIFMTGNYGAGENTIIKNLVKENKAGGWSKNQAQKFFNDYTKSMDDLVPEMKQLSSEIYDMLKRADVSELSWKTMDGIEIKFEAPTTKRGTYKLRGKDNEIVMEFADLQEASRGLMPNVIHSVDGYVARRMRELGSHTNHDAFFVPKNMTEAQVQKNFATVMKEVKNSNHLEDVLKSLSGDKNYKMKTKISGKKLTDANIDLASTKHAVEPEEVAGQSVTPKARQREDSYQKKHTDLVREFMEQKNHREINTNEMVDNIVAEGVYNKSVAVAKEGDTVAERQVAMAFQSPVYNVDKAIPNPKQVPKRIWNKVQQEVFNEARAKLEHNPTMNDRLIGKRIYFNKDGSIVGKNKLSRKERLRRETALAIEKDSKTSLTPVKLSNTAPKEVSKLKVDATTPIKAKQKVETPKIKKEEAKFFDDGRTTKDWEQKSIWDKDNPQNPMYNKNNKADKEYKELFRNKNYAESRIAQRKETLYKQMNKIPKEAKKGMIDNILETDYSAIRGMSKADADTLMSSKQAKYILAKPDAEKIIKQTARGMGKKSEQYGYFMNNPAMIAKELNLPETATPWIDKMVSIQAMNNKKGSWDFVEKHKDNTAFKDSLNLIEKNQEGSVALLKAQGGENNYIKGYTTEPKNEALTINETTGKVETNVEMSNERGIIDTIDKTKARLGREIDGTFTKAEMQEKRIKQTGNKFYKIGSEEIRTELGKSKDFAEILADTNEKLAMKYNENANLVQLEKMLKESSELVSSTPKKGMIALSKEDKMLLPKSMKKKLNYINEAYYPELFGREAQRFAKENSTRTVKLVDKVLAEFGTKLKQNVVLKNIPSYANAVVVNFTTGLSVHMSPTTTARFSIEAINQTNKNNRLRTMLGKAYTDGNKKKYDKINRELDKSLLHRMEVEGLSVNRVEGLLTPTTVIDNAVSKWSTNMIGEKATKAMSNIMLNSGTKAGKEVTKVFSHIDTTGRYAVAKNNLIKKYGKDESKYTAEAIRESVDLANGLFADMDKMASPLIQKLDAYGIAPFIKWASFSFPTALRVAKENPRTAVALIVGTYVASTETGIDFQSQSPLSQFVDMGEDYVMTVPDLLDGTKTLDDKVVSATMPSYLKNLMLDYKRNDPISMIKPRTKKDPRKGQPDRKAFVQKSIDSVTGWNKGKDK